MYYVHYINIKCVFIYFKWLTDYFSVSPTDSFIVIFLFSLPRDLPQFVIQYSKLIVLLQKQTNAIRKKKSFACHFLFISVFND